MATANRAVISRGGAFSRRSQDRQDPPPTPDSYAGGNRFESLAPCETPAPIPRPASTGITQPPGTNGSAMMIPARTAVPTPATTGTAGFFTASTNRNFSRTNLRVLKYPKPPSPSATISSTTLHVSSQRISTKRTAHEFQGLAPGGPIWFGHGRASDFRNTSMSPSSL